TANATSTFVTVSNTGLTTISNLAAPTAVVTALTTTNSIGTNATSTFADITNKLFVENDAQFAGFSSCTLTTDGSGNLTCGAGGGGGGTNGNDSNWTFFNGSGLRLVTTTNQIVIGTGATTSLASLEIGGTAVTSAYFKNNVGIGTTSPAMKFGVEGSGL